MAEIDSFSRALKLFGRPPRPSGKCASCTYFPPWDARVEPSGRCIMRQITVDFMETCYRWSDLPF